MLCLQFRTKQKTVLFEDIYYCYETRMEGELLFMVLVCSPNFLGVFWGGKSGRGGHQRSCSVSPFSGKIVQKGIGQLSEFVKLEEEIRQPSVRTAFMCCFEESLD